MFAVAGGCVDGVGVLSLLCLLLFFVAGADVLPVAVVVVVCWLLLVIACWLLQYVLMLPCLWCCRVCSLLMCVVCHVCCACSVIVAGTAAVVAGCC